MRLFDIFRKEPKQPEVNESKIMYSMPTADGEEIMLFNLEKIYTIQHRNNELTDLMMARVVKQNVKDTIYFDDAYYIGFELPQGISMDDEIVNAVMKQYSQGGNEYIGRLMSNRNGYFFGNRSESVKNILSEVIQERQKQKMKHLEQRRQEKQEGQQKQRKRDEFLREIDQREYLNRLEQERNRRKQSPTLKESILAYERQGGKTYCNYDGVNIETGDFLRIRKVDKVGKDGSGTYLYSAYINNTPNEHDVEVLGKTPMGFPVCFELSKRLEDIVRDGDLNEIRQVLQLLSNGRNFEDPKQLNYIGGIDKNGQINRSAISPSSAIQATIEKMKTQFAEQMKQEGR